MAVQEGIAGFPAPALVQQALREVLWGDMEAVSLPKHLRRDVEGVRGLEGEFLVNGVKVEFRKVGGGELSVEEWRLRHAKFGGMPLPKVGEVLNMRRNKGMKRWELRSTTMGRSWTWKLGRIVKKGTHEGRVKQWVEEVMVEQGGLVASQLQLTAVSAARGL